jgi:cytochrome o ubiquinol oxidase subunit 2
MQSILKTLRKVFSLGLFLTTFLMVSGCSSDRKLSFLDPQGPVAAAQRGHLIEVVALVMIVVLPVLALAPYFAWRYRYGATASRYTPKWSFSKRLEIVVWGIPVAIVMVLAALLLRSTQTLDPYQPLGSGQPPLRVQVIGYDWKWLFIYPDQGIASLGEMAFPAGRPLALNLTSATVMQAFFIPALGSQIYAMGGMTTQLHLLANQPGRFLGENTQFNGRGFHEQKFTAIAMPPDDFTAWVERVRSTGISLTASAYQALSQRGVLTELKLFRQGRLQRRFLLALSQRGVLTELRASLPAMKTQTPDDHLYLTDVPAQLFPAVVAATRQGSPAPINQLFAQQDDVSTSATSDAAHRLGQPIAGDTP